MKCRILSDWSAVEDNLLDYRGLVAVRDEGERRNRLGDDKVRFLADGDGTELVADAHSIGGVDRAGVERLFGSKAHTDTSEGHYKPHVAARTRSRVVI